MINAKDKSKAGTWRTAILHIEKVGSPKHSEGREGVRRVYLGRGLPGRETSKCKGPEREWP